MTPDTAATTAAASIKRQDQHVIAIISVFARAEKAIIVAIQRGLRERSRRMRNRYRHAAQAASTAALRETAPRVRALVDDAFTSGVEIGAASLGEKLQTLGKLDRDAIDLLHQSAGSRLADATSHLGRQVDDVFRKEGLRSAALHLASELPHGIEARGLKQRLEAQGLHAFVDKSGRTWGLDQYASMVLKTTAAESMFTGTQQLMLRRGFDLIQVNHVLNPCPRCAKYDGNVYSLAGLDATPETPLLGIVFPVHPHCRHFIAPAKGANAARAARLDRIVRT